MLSKLIAASLVATVSAGAAWHQVFIPVADKAQQRQLIEELGGLDPCGAVISEAGVELPVDSAQLAGLERAGYEVEILLADMEEFYSSRLAASRNYGDFHTYSEGMAEIQQLAADFPSIVSPPEVIGTTVEGNNIWALKISDNPQVDEDEPEVFYNSYIHAREAITIEVLLHFMHHLTDNYGTDLRVTEIVDSRELWFVPFMNPDGVLYNEATQPNGGGMWRKNRRNNGDGSMGVDLNRNFGYEWGFDNSGSSPFGSDETYRGSGPFSEPESQVIRDFVNSHNFTTSITYHSYSNLYIYPWGYDELYTPEPDHSAFVLMTNTMAQSNGYSPGTSWELLYSVNGDTDDWFYGATGEHNKILAITPEVGSSSDGFWPLESRIPALVAENLEPNLFFAENAGNPWASLPPAAPALNEVGAVGSTYQLAWSTPQPEPSNPAVSYELHEMTGLTVGSDPFDNADNWGTGGTAFVLSPDRSFSAPNSFYGGTGNMRSAISELGEMLAAEVGLNVEFQAWFDIENDWDYAYLELSTDGFVWSSIAGNITTTSNPNGNNSGNGITGNSGGWVLASFPLDNWAGQNVFLRLRYTTDQSVLEEGIYVDDFSPVRSFASEIVLDDNILAENFTINNQPDGDYWYKVRARDAEGDLSAWSNVIAVQATGGEDLTGPTYSHAPLGDTTDNQGPWPVQVGVNDISGVAWTELDYRVNAGSWMTSTMSQAGQTWSGSISGPHSYGAIIEYRFRAEDASENANPSTSSVWSFQILPPAGLEYCQDFENGFEDWTVVTHDAGGNTWVIDTYDGQGQTAYIQYSSNGQEDHASLITPVFDCSEQGTLQLSFWHRLKLGYSGAFTDAYLWGSIDGGLNWSYMLAEWHDDDQAGEFTVEGSESLDISSWAAGQAQVALRFEFHDEYDWYWNVDDVCLTGTLDLVPDPVMLEITHVGGDILLDWQPALNAHEYHVYVSLTPWGDYTLLGTTGDTNWLDVGGVVVGQRFYLVRAASLARTSVDPEDIPRLDPLANARPAVPVSKLDR